MARACENLPEAKKARIDGLKQNFSIEVTVETQHVALMEEQRQLKPPVTHLVVRTHPELGRKSLHLRPPHSIGLADLPADKGARPPRGTRRQGGPARIHLDARVARRRRRDLG